MLCMCVDRDIRDKYVKVRNTGWRLGVTTWSGKSFHLFKTVELTRAGKKKDDDL